MKVQMSVRKVIETWVELANVESSRKVHVIHDALSQKLPSELTTIDLPAYDPEQSRLMEGRRILVDAGPTVLATSRLVCASVGSRRRADSCSSDAVGYILFLAADADPNSNEIRDHKYVNKEEPQVMLEDPGGCL